jgi:hypothetical protein
MLYQNGDDYWHFQSIFEQTDFTHHLYFLFEIHAGNPAYLMN